MPSAVSLMLRSALRARLEARIASLQLLHHFIPNFSDGLA